MRDVFIAMGIAQLCLIVLLLVRVARGPSVCDRIVAVNTISVQAAIAALFFSAFADRSNYLEAALFLASFSYLGALVWARYLERGLL